MSLASNGMTLYCDSNDCDSTADVPVALRSPSAITGQAISPTDGWLFVVREDQTQHFCSRCAQTRLSSLLHSAEMPKASDVDGRPSV